MIFNYEIWIRLSCFSVMLCLLILCEKFFPRRDWRYPKTVRWLSHLGIVSLNTLILRLAFPILAIDAALIAEKHSWGLMNYLIIPRWLTVVISVCLLDLTIYLQHVLFHYVPILWRVHRMHHADLDIDATTGIRFHPIEIILSMGIKISVVILLGAPASAVLIFEVLLNATTMFNHANWKLPLPVDRLLRKVIVTPDMHRVHHSLDKQETNRNFGFNFSFWDRLFNTYRSQPSAGHQRMTIGIEQFREQKFLNLPWMLLIPFITLSSTKETEPEKEKTDKY